MGDLLDACALVLVALRIMPGHREFPVAKAEYHGRFPLVEVQQTFYQPPRVSTSEKWRLDAPADFEFTLKGVAGDRSGGTGHL